MNANATDGLVVLDLPRPARNTYGRARRRYRVAQWACTLLALAAVAYLVWTSAGSDGLSVAAQNKGFDVQSIVLLAFAGALPWLAADMLWRRTRRRNFWEWQ